MEQEFTVTEIEQEVWRDIIGYEGLYMVSSLGRVKSFHGGKERILKQTINKGYLRVGLSKGKKEKNN